MLRPTPDTFRPGSGKQSRLCPLPPGAGNDWLTPSESHGSPSFGPLTHVPFLLPSAITSSPSQYGHGNHVPSPVNTTERRRTELSASPVSTLTVPLMSSASLLTTHAGVLPADKDSGGP